MRQRHAGAVLGVLSLWGCHPATQTTADGGGTSTTRICPTAITGTMPFGTTLTAQATYKSASGATLGTQTESLDIFFPEGRSSASSVIVTHPSTWPTPELVAGNGTLNATSGSAPIKLQFNDQQNTTALVTVSGSLIGPDDGFSATVTRDFGTTAAPNPSTVTLMFCDSGQGPTAPKLTLLTGPPFPLANLVWESSVPLNIASTDPLAIQAGTTALTTMPIATATSFEVDVTPAWPPGLMLQLTGGPPLDVIGRTVTMDVLPAPLVPTTPLTDLSLATMPPAGSFVGWPVQPEWQNGLITMSDPGWSRPYELIVSLGDPGTSTHVYLQLQVDCPSGSDDMVDTTVELIAASGVGENIATSCSSGLLSSHNAVPAAGPLWLAVYYNPSANFDTTKFPGPPSNVFKLGSVTLEP